MKKASIIMAVLACAIIAAAYTNSAPISTNTRAATEKWTAIRFEPALPPTPENAASKFLDGNREWQTVTAAQIGALTNETDEAALAALSAYAAYWPRNATASSRFAFTTNSGAITITGYDGGGDVVIPDYINGWPVTAVGANAFAGSGVTSICGAGNVVTVGDSAFMGCTSLDSVSLPQAQTVGDYAFYYCGSLASVPLPQVRTAGNNAFGRCFSLASVLLPQVQTVGAFAFVECYSLASVYFDSDAPTIGTDIFSEITPNQVTIYVTNPQATGWGATFAGMPVVRLPLYTDAITLNGDTITEWPAGGGETSIIAPLYDSGTNVTVTSTQSVYSVAVTGAGPVGIDWSGLSLDGTGRAEVTLRLNVTEWGGTNVTFSPSLTFDRTPEILVTGVWEFAASTVDGTTTRVKQTWPECCSGMWAQIPFRASGDAGAYIPINILTASSATGEVWSVKHDTSAHSILRYSFGVLPSGLTSVDVYTRRVISGIGYTPYEQYGNRTITSRNLLVAHPPATTHTGIWQSDITRLSIGEVPSGNLQVLFVARRPMNANERAAYEAGWRP